MIFLIEYDRKAGQLLALEAFEPSAQADAEEKRLEIELENLKNKIIYEVVLLEAPSESELRRTHRRYFENLEQLAANPIGLSPTRNN